MNAEVVQFSKVGKEPREIILYQVYVDKTIHRREVYDEPLEKAVAELKRLPGVSHITIYTRGRSIQATSRWEDVCNE